jgi:hypothetical protein
MRSLHGSQPLQGSIVTFAGLQPQQSCSLCNAMPWQEGENAASPGLHTLQGSNVWWLATSDGLKPLRDCHLRYSSSLNSFETSAGLQPLVGVAALAVLQPP